MLIGEVVRQTGLSRDTIRYYEKRGLLGTIVRRSNGYKDYSTATVRRVQFVRRLQALGFSLREIADYLALYDSNRMTCKATAPCLQRKLQAIDSEIEHLRQTKAALQEFFGPCSGRSSTATCRPLWSLLDRPN